MAKVGPGALADEGIAPEPLLNNASDFEYITILNPLPDEFYVQVAQDVPINVPMTLRAPTAMTQTERDVAQQYGLGSLKGPDHLARKPIFNRAMIPPGQSMNFKGGDAQVVVRQLVNELLQREGKKRMMYDPYVRREAEQRVVIRRGTMQEIMDKQLITPQQQMNEAITKSNEVHNEEVAFPGLENTGTAEQPANTEDASTSSKRPVATTKK